MKKLLMGILALLASLLPAVAQDGLPTFSTEAAPKYYQIVFSTGGAILCDKGAGANVLTAAASSTESGTLWQFIGNASSCKLKSNRGNYLSMGTSYFTTTSNASSAATMRIVSAGTTGDFELQRTNGGGKSMNQWGGTGAGKNLGEWTSGDVNNRLYFEAAAEVTNPYFTPTFASSVTADAPYYIIQFCNTKNVLADKGLNNKCLTAVLNGAAAQQWKLVGNANNFQMISRDGHYAVRDASAGRIYARSTPDVSGFKLVSSTNSTYSPCWEIQSLAVTSTQNRMNQWSDPAVGQELGFWNAGDANNCFLFVDASNMKLPYAIEGSTTYTPSHPLTLWYRQPAEEWMEYALPIGNGHLGASIFGGITKDEIQFNEKTLWSGRSTDNGTEYGDYENFGSVFVEDMGHEFGSESAQAVKDYVRNLDLSNATASVLYKSPDLQTQYTRQYIVSYPDNVIAARYTANKGGKISLRFTLVSGKPGVRATTTYSADGGYFAGKLETVSYNARFRVVPTGGTMTSSAEGITVTGADEVLLLLCGMTDFDPYTESFVSGTTNLASRVSATINDAAYKGWNAIYAAHVADYKSYFDRCHFELAGATNTMATNELITQYARRSSGKEPYALMLEQLYFAYGRYLEISSSRGVDLPSNLQGIWNNSSEPAWNADIHSNINVQMNYWPAETTNLSEMHLPFLNYITNMATNHTQWKKYAQDAGQSVGWTCYTENNIFGGVGSFAHYYVIANAWYCTHLWQHYRYTLDRAFLKGAFPTMWSATQFWLARLKLASDGTYECPQEYSPEHGPYQDGVAHAQQLVWELFDNTIKAAEILGSDANLTTAQLNDLRNKFQRLDRGLATETYTGNWGTNKNGVITGAKLLREWKYSAYSVGENGHRHMSHLMCLYPFSQVKKGDAYFDAAINSMKLRGDASTGWSMGWKINLWARAQDGNHAHTILELALRHHSVAGGGVYYNLWDSHSPFQIDGNFGACAGIAEMLMQSVNDTIQILPALPSVWQEGSIRGLKAVGDFTVDIAWKAGKATTVHITSNQGQPLYVSGADLAKKTLTVDGMPAQIVKISDNTVRVMLPAGKTLDVDFTRDFATSIAAVGETPASGKHTRYDLQGRPLSAPIRGVYIQDGTKRIGL